MLAQGQGCQAQVQVTSVMVGSSLSQELCVMYTEQLDYNITRPFFESPLMSKRFCTWVSIESVVPHATSTPFIKRQAIPIVHLHHNLTTPTMLIQHPGLRSLTGCVNELSLYHPDFELQGFLVSCLCSKPTPRRHLLQHCRQQAKITS